MTPSHDSPDLGTRERLRVGLQLAVFLTCFFAVWSLRATYLFSIDRAITSPLGKVVYSTSVKFLLWIVPAVVYAVWVGRTRPAQYLGLLPFPRWHVWRPCLLVTTGFLAVIVAVELGIREQSIIWTRLTSGSWLATCLSLVATPLMEEILFRGLVMRELMSATRWLRANIAASLLFVGIHLPHWIWRDGLTQVTLAQAAGVFVFSLLAGWLYAKSRSVWPPALAHTLNNGLALLLHG